MSDSNSFEVEIEFIDSNGNSSKQEATTAENFSEQDIPAKQVNIQSAESIQEMQYQNVLKREAQLAEGEIELNTDLDLELLKKKYAAPSSDDKTSSLDIKVVSTEVQTQSPEEYYKGLRVLINAGPTYEKIDDVRFIANYSSGKMGFALAEAAAKLGAEVVLVAGPVNLECSKSIYRVNVTNAAEMHAEMMKYCSEAKVMILAAAVADFTPKVKFDGKIKKTQDSDTMILELVKTKDILTDLGKSKTSEQKLIGFALEADNMIENAKDKMQRKNCDMIIANKANVKDSGFGGDNNTITIIKKDNTMKQLPTMSKNDVAMEILKEIITI